MIVTGLRIVLLLLRAALVGVIAGVVGGGLGAAVALLFGASPMEWGQVCFWSWAGLAMVLGIGESLDFIIRHVRDRLKYERTKAQLEAAGVWDPRLNRP